MLSAIELLTSLHSEAEEAVLRLADTKHRVETLEYWKGRRDGIAYAIRELQQATGNFGASDFLSATGEAAKAAGWIYPELADELPTLGAQLQADHDRHRTVESDHERMD